MVKPRLSAERPTLEASIARAAVGIDDAGRRTAAAAPGSATIATTLAYFLSDVPALQITLRRDCG